MRRKKPRAPKPPKRQKKAKASTGQTTEAVASAAPQFVNFLDEMIRWFSDHQEQVDRLFGLGDSDGDGSVHLKDFELGLASLDVPRQRVQLQTLTQLLKNADNTIRYRDLSGQVRRLRLRSAGVGGQVSEEASLKEPASERRCVRLRVRLIPFDAAAAHPGNFEVVLPTRTKVASLTRIILERVGIQTCRLEVFQRRQSTEEARLPPHCTLEECGFEGGPEESPAEDTVYYDYAPPLTRCPLLNCDHYFAFL